LHERAIQLRTLGPADIRISAAGLPCLATGAKLVSVGRFEPERAALDLAQALAPFPPDDARALLAGYARVGFELLDRERLGFTEAVLEVIRAPSPWPRPHPAPHDLAKLLED